MSKTAPSRDLSAAYSELETAVTEAHNAMLLMEMAAESTVLKVSMSVADVINRRAGDLLKDYRVFALTEDEHEALAYAISHAVDNVRALRRQYYAAHGEEV